MTAKGWTLQKQEQVQPSSDNYEKSDDQADLSPAALHAEKVRQRKDESEACSQQHKDGTFKTWKLVADCTNRTWLRYAKYDYYSSAHHHMDLVAALNATRSQLAEELDANKITEADAKAKIEEKMVELRQKASDFP
jgi:hypothetical protein